MPVRVDIPIRIHVDPGALTERRSDLEDALTAATERALKNSRDVVLAERGGYVGVKVHPPEVVWSGNGLGKVPEATRLEIEERIGGLLDRAVVTAGIYDFTKVKESLAQVLPDEFNEPFVQERFDSKLDAYKVPVYRRMGEDKPIVLARESKKAPHKEIQRPSKAPGDLIKSFILPVYGLQKKSLGLYLLLLVRSSLSYSHYVKSVISKLDDSYRDDVSEIFTTEATDKDLEKLARNSEGKKLLDFLKRELVSGIPFANERKQQLRISLIQEATYPESLKLIPKKLNPRQLLSKFGIQLGLSGLSVIHKDLLGLFLLQLAKTSFSNCKYVQDVLDELGSTARDDVSKEFTLRASDEDLTKLIGKPEGIGLLDRIYDELTSGSLGGDEEKQAHRILLVRGKVSSPEEIWKQRTEKRTLLNLGNRKLVFPIRLPGITTFGKDGVVRVERRGGGKIWVKIPMRIYNNAKIYGRFLAEVKTLPWVIFTQGIELNADQWISVKDYDEGGIIIERPAAYLIELANRGDTRIWETIGTVGPLALSLGMSGPAFATGAVAKSLTQRIATKLIGAKATAIIASGIKVASGALFAAGILIKEHRGWIIKKWGKSGRKFVNDFELLNTFAAVYGITRLATTVIGKGGSTIFTRLSDGVKSSWQKIIHGRQFKQAAGSDLKKTQEITQSTEQFLKEADKLNAEVKRQRDFSRSKPWLEAKTLLKKREGFRQASPQPHQASQEQEATRKLVRRRRGIPSEAIASQRWDPKSGARLRARGRVEVWVNTRSGKIHPKGSHHWREQENLYQKGQKRAHWEKMTLRKALDKKYVLAKKPRPKRQIKPGRQREIDAKNWYIQEGRQQLFGKAADPNKIYEQVVVFHRVKGAYIEFKGVIGQTKLGVTKERGRRLDLVDLTDESSPKILEVGKRKASKSEVSRKESQADVWEQAKEEAEDLRGQGGDGEIYGRLKDGSYRRITNGQYQPLELD